MTRTVKISALILSILVVIAGLPMTVFGAEFNEWLESNASEAYSGSADLSLQKGVYELNELREENVKHFRQEDGSNVAVVYSDAVHYMDADGEWQDIDNTLSDDGNEYGTSNARIKFAKKTTGKETLFTLHENNRKITLSLDGAIKKTQGSVRASESVLSEDATQLQKLMELSKLSSTISYADILDGVDLEYDVVSMNIKERIVVKEKLSSYDYSFTLALNNLSARLAEDGSVELYDTSTKETAYVIPAPFMYDSSEEYSDAVYYTLTDLGNGKYKLLISADDEWINAENRTFPVTIDPAVYPATESDVTDTYINSYSKTLAPYNYQYLYVGNTTQFYWKTKNMPTIPKSAYITKATFTAKYIGGTAETSTYYFGAYQVTSEWDNTLTWNKYKASPASGAYVYADIVDYTTATLTAGVPKDYTYTWDVTEIMRNCKDSNSFKGICISDIPGYTTKNTKFASSEYTTVADRPKLLIEYRDMKGVEDYWSYTAQNIGNAGTGYINNATGNLTLAISTLATTDALFGYAPTMVYNSSIANKVYTNANANVPYTQTQAGYGFKLSTQESIVEKDYISEDNEEEKYYIWADSDGTEHAFYPDDNNAGLFYDEDGLGLKLTTESDIETGTVTVTITDRSYNQKIFTAYNGGWVMSSIRDTSGNELVFTLDVNARVTKISVKPNGLSAIDFLTLTYNSSGVLSRIENTSAKRAVIFNYSSNYLTQVKYAHITTSGDVVDYSASYEYDSEGNIVKARDNTSLYEVNYTYTNKKVTAVTEKGGTTFGTTGQTVGISYNGSQTEVRSSGKDDIYNTTDDLLTKYVFDYAGRTITAYSTDFNGTTIYGASAGEYVSDNKFAENHIKSSTVVGGASTNYILNGGFELVDANSVPKYWNILGDISLEQQRKGFGNYSIAFNMSAYDVLEAYQYVQLPAGEYTLSLEVDARDVGSEGYEFYVKVQSLTNSSRVFTENIAQNKAYATGDPSFVTLDFKTEEGLTSELYKISIYADGYNNDNDMIAYIDNVMLENNSGNGTHSMVSGGSFENSSVESSGTLLNTPASLWNISSGAVVSTTQPFGNVLKLNGSLSSDVYAEQILYTITESNRMLIDDGEMGPLYDTIFKVSGFGKAETQMGNSNSIFGIRLEIKYYTQEGSSTESKLFKFNNETTGWQYLVGTFAANSERTIEEIKVICVYNKNYGSAYFDEIKVEAVEDDSALIYDYHNNGLVKGYRSGLEIVYNTYNSNDLIEYSVSRLSKQITKYTYEHPNAYLLSGVSTYNYDAHIMRTVTYDAIHQNIVTPLASNNTSGYNLYSTTTYAYNNYGQPTTITTTGKDSASKLISANEYDVTAGSKIFGALTAKTDTNGDTARFFYDSATGELKATIDGRNGGYVYSYDDAGRVTQVLPASYSSSQYSAVSGSSEATYSYEAPGQRLSRIVTTTTTYNFTYDAFGKSTSISAGDSTLVSYTYIQNSNSENPEVNGKLETETYANGFGVKYVYDTLDRIAEIWYNTNGGTYTQAYKYHYDGNGNVSKIEDFINDKVKLMKYDNNNRFVFSTEYSSDYDTIGALNEYGLYATYDGQSRLENFHFSFDYVYSTDHNDLVNLEYSYSYADSTDHGSASTVSWLSIGVGYGSNGYTIRNITDAFDRRTSSIVTMNNGTTNTVYSTEIGYTTRTVSGESITGTQIGSYTSSINGSAIDSLGYEYDGNGNITRIYKVSTGATVCSYQYDNLNRLTRENNADLGETYVYSYDNGGNIRSKKTYAYTTGTLTGVTPTQTDTYDYGMDTGEPDPEDWNDRLWGYNGVEISHDDSGNPLSYYNGSSYTFTWTQGRRLATAVKGSTNVSYTYNESGIRTSKTVDGIKHTYVLNGTSVYSDTWKEGIVTHVVVYVYGDNGSPIGMMYRNSTMGEGVFEYYIFAKNLQGDIIAVYNSNGTKLVSYKYDAWGNVTRIYSNGGGSTAVRYNSFRYRGYFYDEETELYYLNSRYYDPATGRFLNPDIYVNANGDLTGFNMYAYCSNNPVMGYDPTGQWDWGVFADIVVNVVAAATAVVVSAVVSTIVTPIATACTKSPVAGHIIGRTVGAVAGMATYGLINNATNAIYYNFISDGESTIGPESYNDRYISRWERLDYTKQETKEDRYNLNAWRYQSEYAAHMYAWYVTGWAFEKDIPIISGVAKSAKSAGVDTQNWDTRGYVKFATVVAGVLGV